VQRNLIAFAIIGGFLLSVGALVALLVWKSGQGGPTSTQIDDKRLADRPISEGNKDDDVAYIIGHRWWKKPPAREKLDDLVKFVIETHAGNSIWIDDEGNCVRTDPEASINYGGQRTWLTPEAMKDRRCMRWTAAGTKRPERAEVIKKLRSELDEHEFKDGPGR